MSLDPSYYNYPWQSGYSYYANSPISTLDYAGLGDEEKEKGAGSSPQGTIYLTTSALIQTKGSEKGKVIEKELSPDEMKAVKSDLESILKNNKLDYKVEIVDSKDKRLKKLGENDYIIDFIPVFAKYANSIDEKEGYGYTYDGISNKKSEVFTNRVPSSFQNSNNDRSYFLAYTAAHEFVHQITEDALFRLGISDSRKLYSKPDYSHTRIGGNMNDRIPVYSLSLNSNGSNISLANVKQLKTTAFLSTNHAELLKLDRRYQNARNSNDQLTLLRIRLEALNNGNYGK